jgi:transcriptional regulator with GAF, ATPase, and Fis domain
VTTDTCPSCLIPLRKREAGARTAGGETISLGVKLMGECAAWFHFCGEDRSTESNIRAHFTAAGIGLCSFEESGWQGYGVLCFPELSNAVLTSLQETRLRGGRILALATSPSILRENNSWQLVHAGASDVLAWDEHGLVLNQIKARLERWGDIDELAELGASRESLVGDSLVWRALVRRVVEAARYTNAPVLLIGESGTGKELLARLIHIADRRVGDQGGSSRELVTVDCSTIMPELSGSELFGHERGAFTGAVNAREGAFSLADGGTLFLDEVGELPIALQAQLLRAVQEKTYKRVGGNVWQNTDFRLVCATNRDLAELVGKEQFRLDLYHRIAGWVFHTPPLRERRDDILPLATHFLKTSGRWETPPEFDGPVREYLLNRSYPGNIRELRQIIQRAAHRHVGPGPLTVGDIPDEDRPVDGVVTRCWPNEQLERSILEAVSLGIGLKEISQVTCDTAIRIAIQSEKGSLQRAARRLGVTDRALQMRRASGKLPA